MEKTIIAKVRLLSTAKATDREFSYLCPYSVSVSRGDVVKIPFGKGDRERYGVVTDVVSEEPTLTLKSISEVLPREISLNEEMLSLCDHLKEQIFCTFGDAARAILPSVVYRKEAKKAKVLSFAGTGDPDEAMSTFRGKNKEKYHALLSYLALSGPTKEKTCRELFEIDASGINLLEKKGLIEIRLDEEERNPFENLEKDGDDRIPSLSPEQEKAFDTLRELFDRKGAKAALLHGVTGSGKTEVMLALCDHALKKGKTVLFLVPEIALTGQSARQLHKRYKDKVALIHSALSEGERRDTYLSVSRGEKPVVLGTRSAVFAPLNDLGLVVIDEEQDQSYKSDTQLKFHARDVARFRCAKNGAMLLLASATPDVESYHKAVTGKYALVQMKKRFGTSSLPKVSIVDLRPDLRRDPSLLIGERLKEEIGLNLKRGEQTILLMNRRGYRRFVSCTDCGHVIRCPHCSVSMTLHNGGQKKLSCHYCGYAVTLPEKCPECGSDRLAAHGYGIQQLEEEIHARFPEARILRLDSDTLSGKSSHETILSEFRKKKADILIGTQMVAKGHNFPDVTLVGIVMADSALYFSDFRAPEHTFTLLTQVIGRAGRAAKEGRAIIQTLNPHHNVFSLAAEQDYEAFFEGEIALRKAFMFPPFCQLAQFTLAHSEEKELLLATKELSESLERELKGEFSDVKIIVYGPFEATVYRMKNIYRKRFIIKYKNNPRTRALLERIVTKGIDPKSNVKLTLDIAPGLI